MVQWAMHGEARVSGSVFHLRGKRYYDFSSGWAAGPLGYNAPSFRRDLRPLLAGFQNPPSSLSDQVRIGLVDGLCKTLGLSGSWHLISEAETRRRNTRTFSPWQKLSGTPLPPDPGIELELMGPWLAGPFSQEELAGARHLSISLPGLPKGMVPALHLSQEPPSEHDPILGHPLWPLYLDLARLVRAPERTRVGLRLDKVFNAFAAKLPGLSPAGGPLLHTFPTQNLGPTEIHPDFPHRIFCGRFTALVCGDKIIMLPNLGEVPEHLGHRLSELGARLKADLETPLT